MLVGPNFGAEATLKITNQLILLKKKISFQSRAVKKFERADKSC